jgi:hypothetical protein
MAMTALFELPMTLNLKPWHCVFCCLTGGRSLCFKCLNQLVISSLVRNAGPSCSPQAVAWLDKIVKPVLASARKGGISMAEQQVCAQAHMWFEYSPAGSATLLLDKIGTPHATCCLQDLWTVSDVADLNPEYCVGSILQDLLAFNNNNQSL